MNLTQVSISIICAVLIFQTNLPAQIADFKHIEFKKADSVASLYQGNSLKDLKLLSAKLTEPLPTEVEKFRSIYKWICDNIENDYALYLKSVRQRKKLKDSTELKAWNKRFTSQLFVELLNKQKTVCSGYAYLLKELALYAGLSCVIINGYGRTVQSNIKGYGIPNHSWNAVQLNKKWYLCDVTWSSGAIDTEEFKFIKNFNEAYFLADPSLFIRNHYPLDSTWMLLDNKPSLHEFLYRPLIYSGIYKYSISTLLPETFEVTSTKGQPISFKFSTDNAKEIEQVELLIKGTGSIHPNLYIDSAGLSCFDHVFNAKGIHIVHILLNHEYVFTYTVKVR